MASQKIGHGGDLHRRILGKAGHVDEVFQTVGVIFRLTGNHMAQHVGGVGIIPAVLQPLLDFLVIRHSQILIRGQGGHPTSSGARSERGKGEQGEQQHSQGDNDHHCQHYPQPSVLLSHRSLNVGCFLRQGRGAPGTHLPVRFHRSRAVGAAGLQSGAALGTGDIGLPHWSSALRAFQIRVAAPHQQIDDKAHQNGDQHGDEGPQGGVHSTAAGVPKDIYSHQNGYYNENSQIDKENDTSYEHDRDLLWVTKTRATTPAPITDRVR